MQIICCFFEFFSVILLKHRSASSRKDQSRQYPRLTALFALFNSKYHKNESAIVNPRTAYRGRPHIYFLHQF